MIPLAAAGWAIVKRPKVLAGIGIALILAFGAWKIHDFGKQAGHESANQAVVEDDRKQVVNEVTELKAKQDAYEERQKQLEAEKARSDSQIRALRAQYDLLRSNLESANREVEHLPDEKVFSDVRAKLGIVPVTDPNPHFVPQELRLIDQAVTEKPLLLDSIKMLTQRIDAIESRERKVNEQLLASQHQLGLQQDAYQSLLAHYQTVWNAVPRKGRSAKCLWIWKCSQAKRLPVPAPADLQRVVESR